MILDYILKGFDSEAEKLAESYTSVSTSTTLSSSGDKGAKAPGTGLGVSTRSPWYRSKKKAPITPDLGSDLNRTSAKGV